MDGSHVTALWRYPVKSMQGEPLAAADIGPRGIVGDRGWAVVDTETGLALTARRQPELLYARAAVHNDDVVITQVILSKPARMGEPGGQVDLEAKAKSDAAVRDLEQRLRDGRHRVKPGPLKKDSSVPGYPQSLELQIRVAPPGEDEPAQPEAPK